MSSSDNLPLRHRLVICGSMSFYFQMVEQSHLLREAGIDSLVPEPDNDLIHSLHENDFQEAKRRASMKHIRKIRDKKTFGILVVNFDKHGISDYIGANAFAEIAVALAHYKKIYLLQGIPEFYRDELTAWQAVCLNGNLMRLIEDCRQAAILDSSQLTLFDS